MSRKFHIRPACQKFLILFLQLSVFLSISGKEWDGGFTAGMIVYLGNKITRVGIFMGGWVSYDFIQFNPGIRGYYNFKGLGPPGKYWELNAYGGLLGSWGKKDDIRNHFITGVSNQTGRRYSFAYSYNLYYDGMDMNQKTGTIAVQINKISVIMENDLLGDTKDRFRTGATVIQYKDKHTILGLNLLLWTGEKGKRFTGTGYPARRGYREVSRYGNYSHGILSLQVQHYTGYGQHVRAEAGIDAEQVRHAFQNRFMHDMCFLPENWVKNPSYHVPMLDTEGNMFLYLPGQTIKKPTPYFNLSLNPGLFY
ncbi:MAG: hypothetical protein LBQ60_03695 [Bacteroidales bacterium]|jgi:hypothetical protein|nr:hypothetical protein [Bacteroidales bacterium]